MKDSQENFTKEEARLKDGRYIIYYNFESPSLNGGSRPAPISEAGKES